MILYRDCFKTFYLSFYLMSKQGMVNFSFFRISYFSLVPPPPKLTDARQSTHLFLSSATKILTSTIFPNLRLQPEYNNTQTNLFSFLDYPATTPKTLFLFSATNQQFTPLNQSTHLFTLISSKLMMSGT